MMARGLVAHLADEMHAMGWADGVKISRAGAAITDMSRNASLYMDDLREAAANFCPQETEMKP